MLPLLLKVAATVVADFSNNLVSIWCKILSLRRVIFPLGWYYNVVTSYESPKPITGAADWSWFFSNLVDVWCKIFFCVGLFRLWRNTLTLLPPVDLQNLLLLFLIKAVSYVVSDFSPITQLLISIKSFYSLVYSSSWVII